MGKVKKVVVETTEYKILGQKIVVPSEIVTFVRLRNGLNVRVHISFLSLGSLGESFNVWVDTEIRDDLSVFKKLVPDEFNEMKNLLSKRFLRGPSSPNNLMDGLEPLKTTVKSNAENLHVALVKLFSRF